MSYALESLDRRGVAASFVWVVTERKQLVRALYVVLRGFFGHTCRNGRVSETATATVAQQSAPSTAYKSSRFGSASASPKLVGTRARRPLCAGLLARRMLTRRLDATYVPAYLLQAGSKKNNHCTETVAEGA